MTREHHGDTVLIGCFDHFFVADRATWLDDSSNACFSKGVEPVAEREEGIGCCDGALRFITCLFDSDAR